MLEQENPLPAATAFTIHACELENRVLYSGSPVPIELMAEPAADAVPDIADMLWEAQHDSIDLDYLVWSIEDATPEMFQAVEEPSTATALPPVSELIFIDTSVDEYQSMIDDVQSQFSDGSVQVVLLDGDDAISQITNALADHDNLQALHIVSHGNQGQVNLGDVALSSNNLTSYAGQIAMWGTALSADADILFYGCDLAASAAGVELLESLSELTDADVAASDDATGHKSLGGDWDLEFAYGQVESSIAFSADFQGSWNQVLATITVDTAADYVSADARWGNTTSIAGLLADKGSDGLISLREAIEAANNTGNGGTPDQIVFNIADGSANQFYYTDDGVAGQVSLANIADATALGGEGFLTIPDPDHIFSWFQIDLAGNPQLAISEAVIIDGFTQWGASQNTLAVGSDAVMRIELTNSAGDSNRGIFIDATGGGSTISGLTINEFGAAAILTNPGANGNTFTGNFIGTDVTGTIDLGNQEGIHLRSGGNTIGGPDPADRNILSGNNSRGVITFTFSPIEAGNIVQNNYIGVDATGLVAMANGGTAGIQVYNQSGMQIIDNVISGNTGHGITFLSGGDAFNTTILGNFIGVGADGTTMIANDDGIRIESDIANGTQIGIAGQGNVIAGNRNSGIVLDGSSSVTTTTIAGNFIGTDLTGLLDLGNVDHGILIENGAFNNTVGGLVAGSGNVIAFNEKDGVNVRNSASDGNAILGNSIYSNDQLAIDLNNDGVTGNDDFGIHVVVTT